MRERNHFCRKFCIRRKSLFNQDVPAMFNTKFCEFMMMRMRRRNINQIDCRIRNKFLVTAVRFSKAIFLRKSSRLFQIAGCHGVAFYAHPLIFQSLNSSGHLCRNMTTPKNRKLQIFHTININRSRPKPPKNFAPPVYRCSRIKSNPFISCRPHSSLSCPPPRGHHPHRQTL